LTDRRNPVAQERERAGIATACQPDGPEHPITRLLRQQRLHGAGAQWRQLEKLKTAIDIPQLRLGGQTGKIRLAR
jgi:hypothetical protein